MRVAADDYYALLLGLRPVGPAWPADDPELRASADALARVHARALALMEESDPRSAYELLTRWEAVCGLPDVCTSGIATTLQERRAAVQARLVGRGGQSPAYFVRLAEALGYRDVTVTEFRPFRAGRARAGHALTNTDAWRHAWRVNSTAGSIRSFRAGASGAGEPLRTWSDGVLECSIRRRAPAHTLVTFAYAPPPDLLADGNGDVLVTETGDAIEI